MTILHYGNLWGLFLLLNNGPMYMKEVLGFNLTSSGALAALPYLARLTFGLIFGIVGDFIKKREYMSVIFIRKFFCLFCKFPNYDLFYNLQKTFLTAHIIPGLLMFAVMFARCNKPFAIAMIMLSLGFNGASTLTNLQNCQDLAPNFAGTIYGLINFIGTTTGFITPAITSFITKDRVRVKATNYMSM